MIHLPHSLKNHGKYYLKNKKITSSIHVDEPPGLFSRYRKYKAGMINLHVINVSCLYLRKNDMDNTENMKNDIDTVPSLNLNLNLRV
jgi:hypothetical protein